MEGKILTCAILVTKGNWTIISHSRESIFASQNERKQERKKERERERETDRAVWSLVISKFCFAAEKPKNRQDFFKFSSNKTRPELEKKKHWPDAQEIFNLLGAGEHLHLEEMAAGNDGHFLMDTDIFKTTNNRILCP